ncbi:MAG: nucleotidyltransferase family protein [Bacteroidota bacterium]
MTTHPRLQRIANQAILFAAGLGTRLRPLTNDRPKALVEVDGTPMLGHVLRRLVRFGFTEVVVNVHHFAGKVEAYLAGEDFGATIHISDERDAILETGGGLLKARPFFRDDQPILVHNVDIFSTVDLRRLVETHVESGALATLAVSERDTSRYLLFDADGQLAGWRNVQTGETRWSRRSEDVEPLALSGIYVLDPQFIGLMTERGKFSVIDPLLRLAADHSIRAYRHDASGWLDVGRPENLQHARHMIS